MTTADTESSTIWLWGYYASRCHVLPIQRLFQWIPSPSVGS